MGQEESGLRGTSSCDVGGREAQVVRIPRALQVPEGDRLVTVKEHATIVIRVVRSVICDLGPQLVDRGNGEIRTASAIEALPQGKAYIELVVAELSRIDAAHR